MKKKIEDYLHLYIGCTVFMHPNFIPNAKESVGRPGYGKLTGDLLADIENKTFPVEPKPVLRPLTSISPEEADHFAWLCMDSEFHLEKDSRITKDEIQTELVTNDGGLLLDADVNVYIGVSVRCFMGTVVIKTDGSIAVYEEDKDDYHPVDNIADKVRYLLSRGFDLFGLIDAGLAIDSTTLNPAAGQTATDI